jgi:hypothetical protein
MVTDGFALFSLLCSAGLMYTENTEQSGLNLHAWITELGAGL